MRNCSSCAHPNPPELERCATCGTLLDATPPDALEAELLALVKGGRLIDAIRRLRERRGLGLKEAKDVVDALEAGRRGVTPPAGPPTPPPPAGEAELVALLKEGRVIEAIKLRRERTGEGLKEAKDAVDRLAAREGLARPSGGCLLLLVPFLFR